MTAPAPRHGLPSPLPVLRAAATYFGWVFGVGFALGVLRVTLLVPRFGERAAELAEMPLMFLVIWLAAGHVANRDRGRLSGGGFLAVGGLALGLLVAAEWLLAVVLSGQGLAEYVAGRDPVSGSVYLVMLLVFAAMPWLRRR